MRKNNLLVLTLMTGLLLVLATTSCVKAQGDQNVNISFNFVNASTENSNSSQFAIEFNVQNGTTLAGSNWTFGSSAFGSFLACNTSAGAAQPSINDAKVNISGCAGDSASNYFYVNLSEGVHFFNLSITFGASLNASSYNGSCAVGGGCGNTTFFVNNYASLAFNAATMNDWVNVSNASASGKYYNYTLNVTLTSVIANMTFNIWNSTMTFDAAHLGANNTKNANRTQGDIGTANLTLASIMWYNIKDGWYTINVTVGPDPNSGYNYSIGRHFVFDSHAPNQSSLTCTGWKSETLSTVLKDATLTCTCSAVEDNQTVSYTYSGGTATPSTATVGEYGISCIAMDLVGNNGTVSSLLTYNVIEDGSADAPGGSGPSSSSTRITGTTFVVTEDQFTEGQTNTLEAEDGFKVTFQSSAAEIPQVHTVKVSEVTATSAVIIIASDPISIKMNIGEEKKVDIDADGIYDVYVKLNAITDGKADVTIMQIEEEAPEGAGPVSGGTGFEDKEDAGMNWTWIIIIIVIIILIGAGVSLKKKK